MPTAREVQSLVGTVLITVGTWLAVSWPWAVFALGLCLLVTTLRGWYE